jgi:hypothetical protein
MAVCCVSRLVFIDYEKRLPPVEDRREPGVSTYFGVANWAGRRHVCCIWINELPKLCQPRTLVRGSGFFKPA